jgi:RNA polymerase sporulation-specific sigma factor
MDELFKKHLPLVHSLVKRYLSEYSEGDDLFQVACIGLLKALRGFDAGRGAAFTTYAVPVISGEIKMYLRGQGSIKYSRALKSQSIRLKKIQEELQQRLGRQPTVNELAEMSGLPREELPAVLDVSSVPLPLESVTPEQLAGSGSQTGVADEVLDRLSVQQALAQLPERERRLVIYRFFRHRTQQEVAENMGISQVHVSRLERKILEKLKRELAH